ncbi:hypothetical protein FRB99_000045 [Tulasnella sp. 403]|nr:hypothetical protein FRB99_000045 [Tulasnella sp. 403]
MSIDPKKAFTIALGIAFLLSFFVSIGAPNIRSFDNVRWSIDNADNALGLFLTELRLGIWGFCSSSNVEGMTCDRTGLGYGFFFKNILTTASSTITPAWTRGLVMSVPATAFVLAALVVSFSGNLIIAALLSWFSGAVTLIFMAINLALYSHVKGAIGDLRIGGDTHLGSGFWMSLVVLILCVVSGFGLLFVHRKEHKNLPAFLNKFLPGNA